MHAWCDSRIFTELFRYTGNTGMPSAISSSSICCGRLARGWNWLTTMPSTCSFSLWSSRSSSISSKRPYSAWREKLSQSKGISTRSAAISADTV